MKQLDLFAAQPAKPRREKHVSYREWVNRWLSDECCGHQMSAGYDVITFDIDGVSVTDNAYYRDCQSCGNIEVVPPTRMRTYYAEAKAKGETLIFQYGDAPSLF